MNFLVIFLLFKKYSVNVNYKITVYCIKSPNFTFARRIHWSLGRTPEVSGKFVVILHRAKYTETARRM